MAQQIKQDIEVDVKVTGAGKAEATLTRIDEKIKSIASHARSLSMAMGSIGKVSFGSNLVNQAGNASRKMESTAKQAKKLNTIWKDMEGNKISVPMSAVKTPKTITMRDMRRQAIGYGMNQPVAKDPVDSKQISKAAAAINQLRAASNTASLGIGKLQGALDGASKSAQGASWNFFRTRAAIAAIGAVVGIAVAGISKWFTLASDYAEANHLFYTTLISSINDVADAEKTATLYGKDVFGNITGDAMQVTPAIAAAADNLERFSTAMMLDPTQAKRTYATFYEMANSAGMATDKIAKLSQGMTQLTYDLSSLWDKPFDETASKLQSGISGISTAVKSYGIDISRTAADQWLLSHGIDATYNSLDRANKMTVMYNMLMEHTATAQGDLARSALQPANMFRILGAQAGVAARSLGAAVFPVVTKLIPLFIMLAQAIQRAAATLASFLGKKLGSWYTDSAKQWNDYLSGLGGGMSGIGGGLDDIEDGLDNVGNAAGNAGSALKEMTNFTLPFDELHMLQDAMNGGGGGGGGGGGALGGGGGVDIPMLDPYDWTSGLTDAILGDAAETLEKLKAMIDKVFDPGTAEAFGRTMTRIWSTLKRNVGAVLTSINQVAKAFDENWDWVDFLDGIAEGFETMNNALTGVITTLLNSIPGLKEWLESIPIIGGLFKVLFDNMDSGIGVAIGMYLAFKPFTVMFKLMKGVLKPVVTLFEKMWKPIKLVGDNLKKVVEPAGKATGGVSKFGEELAKAASASKLGKFVKGIGKVFGPIGIAVQVVDGLRYIGNTLIPQELEKWGNIFNSEDPIGTYFETVKNYVMSGEFIDNLLGLGLWEGAWNDLKTLWKNITDGAWQLGENMAKAIQNKFGETAETAKYYGELAAENGAGPIESMFYTVVQTLGKTLFNVDDAWNKIAGVFKGVTGKIIGFAGQIYDGVTGNFIKLGDEVVKILGVFGIDVSQQWQTIKDNIQTTSDNIKNLSNGNFNETADQGGNAMTRMGQMVANAMSRANQDTNHYSRNIKNNVSTNMHNANVNSNNAVNNLANTISHEMYRSDDNVARRSHNMRNSFGASWPKPYIPMPHFSWRSQKVGPINIPIFDGVSWYAKGGIFNGATIAGIGEAGPEAVVPLQGARMKPFAEAIASNIKHVGSGNVTSNDTDWDGLIIAMSNAVYNAVVRGFPKEIKTNMNLNGVALYNELDKIGKQQGVGTSLLA